MQIDKHAEAKDVGISQYRASSEYGFCALIKSRFSDFVVNEVCESGEVVRLKELSVPDFPVSCGPASSQDANSHEVFSAEEQSRIQEQLEEFVRLHLEGKVVEDTLDLAIGNDKAKRKAVHELIRKLHNGKLISETREDNSSVIRVSFLKQRSGQNNRQSARGDPFRGPSWPKTAPNYLEFAMYKQNRDTIEAIDLIAQRLHVAPRRFTFAGTKDRHAKTTQLVTAYRIKAEDLARCVNALSNRQAKRRTDDDAPCESINNGVRGVKVGNFRYTDRPLRLGALAGNRFCIVLRDLKLCDDSIALSSSDIQAEIQRRVEGLQSNGFINYFGTQRFGTRSQPTWRIGRCLLQRNWRGAVELLLEHSNALKRKFQEGSSGAQNQEAEAELRKVIDRNTVDSQLRRGVDKYGYTLQAIQTLPRTIRTLYVHAYQSYLWNTVVSRRFQEFGSLLLDGDLVQVASEASTNAAVSSEQTEAPKEVTNDDGNEEEGEDDEKLEDLQSSRVAFTTVKKGVNDSKYSVYDVLLPMVGYDVTMPNNVMRDWYIQMLRDDGLVPADSESFDSLRNSVKDFSLPGAYRRICVKPADVEFEWKSYSSPTDQLCDADWELLMKSESNTSTADAAGSCDKSSLSEDAKRALIIKFTLPSSCYATVALRELLHSDV